MPWKPIEIKPQDQSLVGRRIKSAREIGSPFGHKILHVAQTGVLVSRRGHSASKEDFFALNDWEIWEEPKRWVPQGGAKFYYVHLNTAEIGEDFADRSTPFLNCYRTREHAELAAKYVREAHERAHEEIGE